MTIIAIVLAIVLVGAISSIAAYLRGPIAGIAAAVGTLMVAAAAYFALVFLITTSMG